MSCLCPFSSPELNSWTHTAFGCHACWPDPFKRLFPYLAYVPTLLKRPTEWPTCDTMSSCPQLPTLHGSPHLCDVQDASNTSAAFSMNDQLSESQTKSSPFILQITPLVQNRPDLIFRTQVCPDQRQEPDTCPLCPPRLQTIERQPQRWLTWLAFRLKLRHADYTHIEENSAKRKFCESKSS